MRSSHPRRVEIYEGDSTKSGMDKDRPLLIVQNDLGNKYSPYTIIVPIHHEKMKLLPVMVSVPKEVAGLKKDSVIDCGHIACVLNVDLGNFVGFLPSTYMAQVDTALKKSLALT